MITCMEYQSSSGVRIATVRRMGEKDWYVLVTEYDDAPLKHQRVKAIKSVTSLTKAQALAREWVQM